MSELITRTADIIAAEINSIKDQTKKIVLTSSIEIGRRLVEAKEMIPHGAWGTWLETHVDYSQRTASNLIKVFSEYGADQQNLLWDNVKSQAFANLSYTQAVALLGINEDERETFIQENDVENMSTRELQKAIKERDEALKAKEDIEKKVKDITKLEKQNKDLAKEMHNNLDKFNLDLEMKEQEKQRAIVALEDAEKKIRELESRPIEVIASAADEEIERIKQEAKIERDKILEKANKEKEEALAKIKELENKKVETPVNVTMSEEEIKFRLLLKDLQIGFNNVNECLTNLKNEDESKGAKYSGALKKLVSRMNEII